MSHWKEDRDTKNQQSIFGTLIKQKQSFMYLIVMLSLSVFVIDFSLMLIFSLYSTLPPVIEAVLDGMLLVTFLFPLLYFTVLLPMVNQNKKNIVDEKELRNSLLYDSLTGLPNRLLFKDRLEQSISIAIREKHSIVLMLVDVNVLQEINDTLSHNCGDQVLKGLADRLLSHFRKSDTIARIASDEFLVMMPKVAIEQAHEMGIKLNQCLEKPFIINGVPVCIEVSMGIVSYPEHGMEPNILMQRVDVALRNAKNRKEEISVYQKENDLHSREKLAMISELRDALSHDDFFLYYQPKINLHSGVICGVEALVRWQHCERGIVSPDNFIPTIERTGLIKPFTEMTLIKAIAQCRHWQTEGLLIKVAVNLSARLLLDKTLPEKILALLEQGKLLPELLELEITESAIMTNPLLAEKILMKLHNAGLTLSIDDFGTGFTSLSFLSQLPVDSLKIDRCFVADMLSNERHAVITNSIIELGHNLGLKIIAEGVEDEVTCNQLKLLGCDIIQGFYFSKPLPADQLSGWISERIDVNN